MKYILVFSILFLICAVANAQMKRERANQDGPVENTFWAPNIVGMGTVESLDAHNLNVTILHSFGIATNRPINNFFGLDIAPNVRLGLDYGITNFWSIGIGRTSAQDVLDMRTKISLVKQTKSSTVPLSISLKGDAGLVTQENNQPVSDDFDFLVSLMGARKFNEHLSLQIAPMYGHFNTGGGNNLFAFGLGAEYHLSRRFALSAEYYPVLGGRNQNTNNAFALALDIETGGHVFQLFFTSSYWHTEQYILARNNNQFFAGDFRFGFDINRLFFLGEE